nr:helix-turn-helix transcriptional regulator [Lachnospiraceae bacterium]
MITDNQNLPIHVGEDLYELKQHGNIDYPIAFYHVDSSQTHLELVHWHWHEEIEYIIVKKGKARFFAGDTCHVLSEGQGIILNANVLHRTKSFEGEDCIYYSVVFHLSLICNRHNHAMAAKYLHPVINNIHAPYFLLDCNDSGTKPLYDTLTKIIQINTDQPYAYELMTKNLLIESWLLILNELKSKSSFPTVHGDIHAIHDAERIKQALTYISNHFADPITLQDIAQSVHISKSECCRCFKRCLKITPFEYLIKYRIYSSVRLLINNDDSVSDIAAMTGFNSSSYFNKMFKKYIGTTPSEFRKKAAIAPKNISQILEGHIHPNDAMLFQDFL